VLVSRLIKPESDLYGRLSNWSKSFDNFMNWQPLHWFGMWCMTISGFSIIKGQDNRYVFWDWNSGSILIFSIIILVTVCTILSVRHPATPKKIENLKSLFYFIVIGSMALLLGSIGPRFSMEAIKNYVPYLLFYISVWLVFSIEFIEQDDKSISIAGSSPRILTLVGSTALIIVGTVMGFHFDDPVASTVSTVYLPFLLVALIMPTHIRHLQRARIYGVFIPAVFLAVRFPWFLIPLWALFFLLRLYHYFRFNIVYPTFGVDHD
jgi:hypothetical protein